jgi:predicted HD phosphohydrolase
MYTDFQKLLYNVHLSVSRNAKNQPYRARKDFSKIDSKTDFCLKKLSVFFESHKEINPKDFFKAPYEIYSKDEHFDLKFFTSQRAINVYKIFMESKKRVEVSQLSAKISKDLGSTIVETKIN